MKTPVPKSTPNGSGPPFGPVEDDPEYKIAQDAFMAARATEDEARLAYQQQDRIRKTSPDKVARARAQATLESLNVRWLEAAAAVQETERDRDAARQRVIAKRRGPWELAYAKSLTRLDDTLQVTVEANVACAAIVEAAEADGVRLDVYHWSELMPGSPHVWTRFDQWRRAMSQCNWFVR